ncbi:MAG: 16S rRNA (guanine(527)-N(7))-methyltransferase RsmG [Gammaproteobacteria bacterium]|nr:16S rRNA (guanine(527)-N(7))-methyltransferase RsmG [Gammaproteobacteria bacterium]
MGIKGKPTRLLGDGLSQLGLNLNSGQRHRLIRYLELLSKWNRVFNLTAVRDPEEMVLRHLLDSLSVMPYLAGNRLLDVGAGAGLPGMVLAIAQPELRCVLLDSNAKKTRFCIQVVAELGLNNVEVVHARLGDYQPREGFSSIISRAFGSIRLLLAAVHGLGSEGARILFMKGTFPGAELDEVDELKECVKVVPLSVPGLAAERHLIIVE